MSSGPHEAVSLELEAIDSGLRFAGHSGSFDLTIDSGPGAVAPNPVRLLMLALGACTGMDVISILRKKRLTVTGYSIAVSGERRAEHPRTFTSLEVIHRVRGPGVPAAAVEEAVRLSATRYCTVNAQIGNSATITHRVEMVADTPQDGAAVQPKGS
jgi:putative redox protein